MKSTKLNFPKFAMFRKHVLICCLLTFLVPSCLFAQLSGTYTIGVGGNYTNLSAVATELNTNCLAGDVLFEFLQTYTSSSESFPIQFNQTSSCGAFNYAVRIRPQLGVNAVLIQGRGFIPRLIDFNGTARVTFDGRAGGIGADRHGYNLALFSAFETRTAGDIFFRHPEYQRVWRDELVPLIERHVIAQGDDERA